MKDKNTLEIKNEGLHGSGGHRLSRPAGGAADVFTNDRMRRGNKMFIEMLFILFLPKI